MTRTFWAVGAIAALLMLALTGYALGVGAPPWTVAGPLVKTTPVQRNAGPVAGSPSARPAVPSAPVRVPGKGSGKFVTAQGDAAVVGRGVVFRYQVAVEAGSGVTVGDFARAVAETLADPRGWTARGRWGFQRVGPGRPHDFVVRLATPATVDRICGEAGLRTLGEVSCQAGGGVIVNLRRWLLAIPAYAGRERDYQHLVVNHEVGHFLGFGHVGCPAPGRPAPPMMQQYFGLAGCRPNPWPYPGDAVPAGASGERSPAAAGRSAVFVQQRRVL